MNYLKFLGCVLICSSASCFGIYKTFTQKEKLNCFLQYKIFLQNIKKHIYFHSFCLNEIFEYSSDIFSKNMLLNSDCYNFFNDKDDIKTVELFLNNLGKTDIDEQLTSIDYQLVFCEERIKEEKLKLNDKSKTNLIFYSFLGLAISLVLY